MSGTKEGGVKVVATIKQKFGPDYYARIGAIGGKICRPETRPFVTNPELARRAGQVGGKKNGRANWSMERKKAWGREMHARRAAKRALAGKTMAPIHDEPKRGLLAWFRGDRT